MSHSENVRKISQRADVPQIQVRKILYALNAEIESSLKAEGKFELKGVGTISVKETAERVGRNPKNGDAVVIPAGKRIKIKASKALKDAIA